METAKLRAWYSHRQGLDGTRHGQAPAEILAQTGWARSVGGAGPYLTLFARGGVGRTAVDAAAAALALQELPAARGCTYVVPAADFAFALALGRNSGEGEIKVARKLGVTDREIDKLCEAVTRVLANGQLDPAQLREAVGSAARNLGEDGKKKGLTTTLPIALGTLQRLGEIRRVPVNGRLDQQRYRYVRWSPNPMQNFKLSPEEANAELARRYFEWIGPARLVEFQWFSGLSATAAKAALEPLGLVPLSAGDHLLLSPQHLAQFNEFKTPPQPHYTLIGGVDGISLLRRDLALMLDPADLQRIVQDESGPKPLSSLKDLPSHAILDRGRIVGLWEFDPESGTIAWSSFGKPDGALKKAVAEMEAYVRDQLGDARSFSLDSPKSRAPRIAALRSGAAHL